MNPSSSSSIRLRFKVVPSGLIFLIHIHVGGKNFIPHVDFFRNWASRTIPISSLINCIDALERRSIRVSLNGPRHKTWRLTLHFRISTFSSSRWANKNIFFLHRDFFDSCVRSLRSWRKIFNWPLLNLNFEWGENHGGRNTSSLSTSPPLIESNGRESTYTE